MNSEITENDNKLKVDNNVKKYTLNQSKAWKGKAAQTQIQPISHVVKKECIVIECNTTAYEVVKANMINALNTELTNANINNNVRVEQAGLEVDQKITVEGKENLTIHLYNTTSKILVQGKGHLFFLNHVLPKLYELLNENEEEIATINEKIGETMRSNKRISPNRDDSFTKNISTNVNGGENKENIFKQIKEVDQYNSDSNNTNGENSKLSTEVDSKMLNGKQGKEVKEPSAKDTTLLKIESETVESQNEREYHGKKDSTEKTIGENVVTVKLANETIKDSITENHNLSDHCGENENNNTVTQNLVKDQYQKTNPNGIKKTDVDNKEGENSEKVSSIDRESEIYEAIEEDKTTEKIVVIEDNENNINIKMDINEEETEQLENENEIDFETSNRQDLETNEINKGKQKGTKRLRLEEDEETVEVDRTDKKGRKLANTVEEENKALAIESQNDNSHSQCLQSHQNKENEEEKINEEQPMNIETNTQTNDIQTDHNYANNEIEESNQEEINVHNVTPKKLEGHKEKASNDDRCKKCKRNVVSNAAFCVSCQKWIHYHCDKTTEEQVHKDFPGDYICKKCIETNDNVQKPDCQTDNSKQSIHIPKTKITITGEDKSTDSQDLSTQLENENKSLNNKIKEMLINLKDQKKEIQNKDRLLNERKNEVTKIHKTNEEYRNQINTLKHQNEVLQKKKDLMESQLQQEKSNWNDNLSKELQIQYEKQEQIKMENQNRMDKMQQQHIRMIAEKDLQINTALKQEEEAKNETTTLKLYIKETEKQSVQLKEKSENILKLQHQCQDLLKENERLNNQNLLLEKENYDIKSLYNKRSEKILQLHNITTSESSSSSEQSTSAKESTSVGNDESNNQLPPMKISIIQQQNAKNNEETSVAQLSTSKASTSEKYDETNKIVPPMKMSILQQEHKVTKNESLFSVQSTSKQSTSSGNGESNKHLQSSIKNGNKVSQTRTYDNQITNKPNQSQNNAKQCYACGGSNHLIKDCEKKVNLFVKFTGDHWINNFKLDEVFGRFGKITSKRIKRDRQGNYTKSAMVCFEKEMEAQRAISVMNNDERWIVRYFDAKTKTSHDDNVEERLPLNREKITPKISSNKSFHWTNREQEVHSPMSFKYEEKQEKENSWNVRKEINNIKTQIGNMYEMLKKFTEHQPTYRH